jgi:hypothetical protein
MGHGGSSGGQRTTRLNLLDGSRAFLYNNVASHDQSDFANLAAAITPTYSLSLRPFRHGTPAGIA